MNTARTLSVSWVLLTIALLSASFTNAATPASNPGLRSASALVTDSAGNVIYGKDIRDTSYQGSSLIEVDFKINKFDTLEEAVYWVKNVV